VTHGIDIWSSEEDPSTIYIFAINHLPNPEYFKETSETPFPEVPKARSQVEIFKHVVGTSEAIHLRSVWHPLIRTPNDLFVENSTSFFTTNDHYYREGTMRTLEEVGYDYAPWSDIVHISLSSLTSTEASADLTASKAHSGVLHNNNGLGHGKDTTEILIGSAASGKLHIGERKPTGSNPVAINVKESIQLDTAIDNPSYFRDPFAIETHRDGSGYVLAGLTRGYDLSESLKDPKSLIPVTTWLVRPVENKPGEWRRTILFQDSGENIRSASAAVIVAIDPKENAGKKQGWLFVTGFLSEAMIATKVDL
jgi:hypothetical protein